MSFQLSLSTESVAVACPDQRLFIAPDVALVNVIESMSEDDNRYLPIVTQNELPAGMTTVCEIISDSGDHIPQAIYNLPAIPDNIIPSEHMDPSEHKGT